MGTAREDEVLLRELLAGTFKTDPDRVARSLSGIEPPTLCRIMIALVSVEHSEIAKLRDTFEEKFDATARRKERIVDTVVAGVLLGIIMAGLKALGAW